MSLDSIIKDSLNTQRTPKIMNNINLINSTINNNHMSQHKLMDVIHQEFKKTFIKKLYPDPKWTQRVYWNVIGRIQNEHEDISLDTIIKRVDQYLENNNMRISQRDLLKFIRDSIQSYQTEGKAKIEDVAAHATENGISADRFNDAIRRMKREGSVFEPRAGYLKSI